jgi:hypothetical protein
MSYLALDHVHLGGDLLLVSFRDRPDWIRQRKIK